MASCPVMQSCSGNFTAAGLEVDGILPATASQGLLDLDSPEMVSRKDARWY
jgi:hypothetical protein